MSIELLVMFERLEFLTYFDGLQFYCEARAEGFSTSWIEETLAVYKRKCSLDFIQGVYDAKFAEKLSEIKKELAVLSA